MTTLDRYRGCLLGLAAGDALGTTLEFQRPGTFAPITDIVGGGPFGLKPGEWTDDTSMALCLAESLVRKRDFDPIDQLETYCRWWRQGHLSATGECFDIGITTRHALRVFEDTRAPFPSSTDPQSAGNGSLMRLAPVPLAFGGDRERAIHLAGESSRTTHGTIECVDSCRYFAGLLLGAMAGKSKEELLGEAHILPKLAAKVHEIAKGSYRRKEPPAIQGSGYVIDTLEAVLWAFHATNDFREGALKVVNLGRDADTTGAIYGQLAGAYYGIDGIPSEWLNKLAMRELIEQQAVELHAMSHI